jgi:hypothetical protein
MDVTTGAVRERAVEDGYEAGIQRITDGNILSAFANGKCVDE